MSIKAVGKSPPATVPAAGIPVSNGTTLTPATVGGGLQLSGTSLWQTLPRSVKTGSYALLDGDRGSLISFTGTVASTITLPSGVAAGWFCVLQHAGTGTTFVAQKLGIVGTLDASVNPAVYPGDCRIIQYNGTAFTSVMLQGGKATIAYADSPATFVKPPGLLGNINVEAWGGGSGATGQSFGLAGNGGDGRVDLAY